MFYITLAIQFIGSEKQPISAIKPTIKIVLAFSFFLVPVLFLEVLSLMLQLLYICIVAQNEINY